MTSMPAPASPVTITTITGGVDCHADSHHAVALDQLGRRLGDAVFPATARGYAQLTAWLCSLGRIDRVGVESTGAYGAGLARHLHRAGVRVVEVNQPHPHTRRRRGKSDAIDAEAAARTAQSGQASAVPKDTSGIVEAIRLLLVARAGAVKAHTAALCQLGELLVTAPEPLRRQIASQRTTLAGRAGVCARLRPDPARLADPTQAAKLALRTVAERALTLKAQATGLHTELARLVGRAAPRTLALRGIGVIHAARLLVTAGQTSTGCTPRQRLRTCAPPTRSRHHPVRPSATGSTPVATAMPTPPCT
jgi:transposase